MAIRWDKFTVKAQEAVQRANEIASEHGNPELLPVHLLAALLEDKEGIVPPVLEKIGIGPQAVLSEIYQEIEKLPKVSGASAQAAMSNQLNQLLDAAFKQAEARSKPGRPGPGTSRPSRRRARRHSQSPDCRPRFAAHHRPES